MAFLVFSRERRQHQAVTQLALHTFVRPANAGGNLCLPAVPLQKTDLLRRGGQRSTLGPGPVSVSAGKAGWDGSRGEKASSTKDTNRGPQM